MNSKELVKRQNIEKMAPEIYLKCKTAKPNFLTQYANT